ncbi:MAG: carbohydrate-binding module 48 [Leptospiraceae bacterium]|nr:carbohydrate-binding module 48 [Leptospiraceae bacterium]
MFKSKFIRILLFLTIFLALGKTFGEDAIEWIGSYSSKEIEGSSGESNKDKVYYYWQIQSLKRAVSPRYIRLIDVENYVKTSSFLQKGVLFTYNGLKSNEVELCGNFYSWKCVPMQRNRYGIYYIVIPANFKGRNEEPKTSYEYKFKVDGIFDFDPNNSERMEDGEGSYYSMFEVMNVDSEKHVSARVIDSETNEDVDFKIVEFRIYKPNAGTVALIGDFNQWNPEHDYLKKDRDGIFVLRKKLKPGEYLYYYVVDGDAELDTYNSETRYRVETEELCSYLVVRKEKMIIATVSK